MTSNIFIPLQLYLSNDLTVRKVDDALGIGSVALRMGHHDDGGTLVVQLTEQFHHLATVLGVEVSRGFIGVMVTHSQRDAAYATRTINLLDGMVVEKTQL